MLTEAYEVIRKVMRNRGPSRERGRSFKHREVQYVYANSWSCPHETIARKRKSALEK